MIDPLTEAIRKKRDPLTEAVYNRNNPPLDRANPVGQAAGNVANIEESLRAVGEVPLQPEKSWWQSGLEHLARPGAATRSALEAARTGGDVGAAFGKGWGNPSSVVTGEQQLEQLGQSNVPVVNTVAKYLGQSGIGRFVGGTALEIAQDPTTLIGGGTQKIPGVAGAAAKRLTLAGKYVGPDLAPAGRVVSDVANVVPGVKGLREKVGSALNPMHVPFEATPAEQVALPKAYEMVANTERALPTLTRRSITERLDAAGAAGIDKTSADAASTLIESLPKTPGRYNQAVQIGKVRASPATAEVQAAAEFSIKSTDADIAEVRRLGLKIDQLQNYVYHRYRNPPEKVRNIFEAEKQKALSLGGNPSFAMTRILSDLNYARSIGLDPYTDIRALAAAHKAEATKMGAFYSLLRGPGGLQSLGKTVIDSVPQPGWKPLGDVPALKGYQLGKNLYVHPEVAKRLTNLAPMIDGSPEGLRLAKMIHGTGMKYFKMLTLGTVGFHARNFTGNIWLNIADGVWNPARYAQSAAVLARKVGSVELAGTRYTTDDILRRFDEYGLRGQGIFHEVGGPGQYPAQAERILQGRESSFGTKLGQAVIPSKSRPLGIVDTAGHGSRVVGETADSYGRMTNFLHHLDLGESFDEAAASVRKALFDYGDLTPLERSIRTYAIPFYPWMRNNLPKQLNLLLSNPKMATGTETVRRNAVSATDTDEANLPSWMRESGALPVGHPDYQSTAYATLNLPLYDLQQIHDPADIRAWAKNITSQLSPAITMIPQLATNTVAYSGAPITDTPDLKDQAMGDYLRFITKQLTGGVGRAYDQAISEEERQRRNLVKESRGLDVPPTVPRIAGPLGTFLPVNVQSQPLQAASAILDRQNLLEQQKKTVEAKKGFGLPLHDAIVAQKGAASGDPLSAAVQARQSSPSRYVPSVQSGDPLTDAANAASYRGGVGRIDVGQAVAVVQRAVAQSGVSRDWEPYLNLVLQKENRKGDPTAVNPTGVVYYENRPNELYHAKGLFQLMDPTFARYAKVAAAKNPEAFQGAFDIMDPTQNTLAAIEYIRANYAHPSKIPGLTQAGYGGY